MKKQFISPEAEVFGVKRNNILTTSPNINNEQGNGIQLAPERMDMPSDINLMGTPADEAVEE